MAGVLITLGSAGCALAFILLLFDVWTPFVDRHLVYDDDRPDETWW